MKYAMIIENNKETGEIVLTLSNEEAHTIYESLKLSVDSQKTKRVTKLSRLFKQLEHIPVW